MKIIDNPKDRGSDIKDVYKKIIYMHPKGAQLRYEDDAVANYVLGKYDFLNQIYLAKKDDPSEYQEPQTEEFYDYNDLRPPRQRREQLKAEREGLDQDGIAWVGRGLEEDRSNTI